ncbi:MAG: hypothetical protein V4577_31425 [Bacteroidota bacterium]
MKKSTKIKFFIFLFFLSAVFFLNVSMKGNGTRQDIPPVVISSVVPTDVSPEVDTFQGNPIAFFDDYSWRLFIAMVWPAKAGERGLPDNTLSLDQPNTPKVFETYKSDWEIFKTDGSAPSPWNDFSTTVPCQTDPIGFNDMVLASFSKFGNLGQAGFGDLVGPLVAQNNTYVRFLTGFNQIEFQQITDQKLYVRSNLTNVTLGTGSIDVKSAWMVMNGVAHPERYYTRQAWVLDPNSGNCSKVLVGLVGLHIVQKTPSRPQWIWTSFEQVDNVPQSGAIAPFAFNDGTVTPMPGSNPILFPPPAIPPSHFNVTRTMPINPSTVTTNQQYQQALKTRNSIWQFYQLVET